MPRKAMRTMYDLYHRRLLRVALNYTREIESAEDIVQEAYIHVWEKRIYLCEDTTMTILQFMMGMVKNRSITCYNRQQRFLRERHNLYDLFTTTEESIEIQQIRQETLIAIRDVIVTFPLREKQCLLMKLEKNMSLPEIAETLTISRKAVERSITAAKRRLRKYWKLLQ